MNWFFWRQHRKQIVLTGIAIVLYAIALIILGAVTQHQYHQALAHNRLLYFSLSGAVRYVPIASIALPLILGMFWGAPLIAKEYEQGTNKFIWTQSVTRQKWLTLQLGWMVATAALFGAITSIAVTEAFRVENNLLFDRFEWVHFDVQGIVPIVYAIFTIVLGVCIGAWVKNVLRALAITLALIVVIQGAMGLYIRPHYKTPLANQTISYFTYPKQGGSGTLTRTTTKGPSVPVTGAIWRVKSTFDFQNGACTKAICTSKQIATTKYDPAYLFWDFQAIETAIYLCASALLVATTYWLVLKRDA